MFERLPSVPLSQELIDRAFRRSTKAAIAPGNEETMVLTASNVLSDNLTNLVRDFPSLEDLPLLYRELTDILVGIDSMRISLSRIHWASRQVKNISKEYLSKMRGSRNKASFRRSAFGRMASVMKSIEKDLLFLNQARDKLRRLPTIESDAPTILVAGYPNVGKSSFIAKITEARPEIASYPFTTQGISVGHFTKGDLKFQVVDMPGLLDRPLSQRNDIELQSIAVLRHLKGVVLLIIDPSGHSGYPIDAQLRLAEDIMSWIGLPVLVAANKIDLADYAGIMTMSTLTGQGVDEVLDRLVNILRET